MVVLLQHSSIREILTGVYAQVLEVQDSGFDFPFVRSWASERGIERSLASTSPAVLMMVPSDPWFHANQITPNITMKLTYVVPSFWKI